MLHKIGEIIVLLNFNSLLSKSFSLTAFFHFYIANKQANHFRHGQRKKNEVGELGNEKVAESWDLLFFPIFFTNSNKTNIESIRDFL